MTKNDCDMEIFGGGHKNFMISSAPCTMEDTKYLDQTGSISVATVACRTRTDSVWQSSYYLRSLKVGAGNCLQVDKSKEC